MEVCPKCVNIQPVCRVCSLCNCTKYYFCEPKSCWNITPESSTGEPSVWICYQCHPEGENMNCEEKLSSDSMEKYTLPPSSTYAEKMVKYEETGNESQNSDYEIMEEYDASDEENVQFSKLIQIKDEEEENQNGTDQKAGPSKSKYEITEKSEMKIEGGESFSIETQYGSGSCPSLESLTEELDDDINPSYDGALLRTTNKSPSPEEEENNNDSAQTTVEESSTLIEATEPGPRELRTACCQEVTPTPNLPLKFTIKEDLWKIINTYRESRTSGSSEPLETKDLSEKPSISIEETLTTDLRSYLESEKHQDLWKIVPRNKQDFKEPLLGENEKPPNMFTIPNEEYEESEMFEIMHKLQELGKYQNLPEEESEELVILPNQFYGKEYGEKQHEENIVSEIPKLKAPDRRLGPSAPDGLLKDTEERNRLYRETLADFMEKYHFEDSLEETIKKEEEPKPKDQELGKLLFSEDLTIIAQKTEDLPVSGELFLTEDHPLSDSLSGDMPVNVPQGSEDPPQVFEENETLLDGNFETDDFKKLKNFWENITGGNVNKHFRRKK